MFTVRELGVFIYVYVFHRAIGHMMSCLLYPLITFVLLLVCVAYWGTTALYPFTLWIRICWKHASCAFVQNSNSRFVQMFL